METEQVYFQPIDQVLSDLDIEQEDYSEFKEMDREKELRDIDAIVRSVTRGEVSIYED